MVALWSYQLLVEMICNFAISQKQYIFCENIKSSITKTSDIKGFKSKQKCSKRTYCGENQLLTLGCVYYLQDWMKMTNNRIGQTL